MLREGLEASLIVGILLAYLASIRRRDRARAVWAGVGGALAVSIAAGAALFLSVRGFEGRVEQIFEGTASVTAVGVLTWMIFWMRRHAVTIKRSLQDQVDRALRSPAKSGLAAVAFVIVLREGIETALFMFGASRSAGAGTVAVGGVLGLAGAAALGLGIYKGGVRMNLSKFFAITGGFLLVVAAGLAAHGAHELIEARILPAGIEQLWNLGSVLGDGTGAGAFLKQLLGYNADPALTEFAVWASYLLVTGTLFVRPIIKFRRTEVAPQSA